MAKIYLRYGVGISVILIVYFLLSALLGLQHYFALSAINGLIYGGGLYLAIKKYASSTTDFKYENGFEVGLLAGGIASIIFTFFMAVYMYQLNTEFAASLMERWNLQYDLGTFMLLISILIMGFATTLVLTLSFMQLLKRSWNTRDGNRNTLK